MPAIAYMFEPNDRELLLVAEFARIGYRGRQIADLLGLEKSKFFQIYGDTYRANLKLNLTEDQKKMVKVLAGLGVTQAEIASLLGVAINSISRHAYKDFDEGRITAKVNIAKKLYEKAAAGDTTCMIFYLKTQAHWSELRVPDEYLHWQQDFDGGMSLLASAEELEGMSEEDLDREIEVLNHQLLSPKAAAQGPKT